MTTPPSDPTWTAGGEGWVELADGRRGRWSDDGAPPAEDPTGTSYAVVRSGAAFEEVRARALAIAPWPQRLRRRLLGDRASPAEEYSVLLPPT